MIKAKALIPVIDTDSPEQTPACDAQSGSPQRTAAGDAVSCSQSASQKLLEKLLWNPRSMVIQAPEKAQPVPESVLRLADLMLENRDLLETVIESLRKSIPAKKYTFFVNVDHLSKAEQKKLVSILYEMAGVMANVHLSGNKPVILSGRLIASSRALSFITGRYVEYALYYRARKVVRKTAESLNTTCQVFHNVIITNQDHVILNEFDLVIELGGLLFVVEIKSGRNFSDFDKYIQIVCNYQLEGRFLLVTSSLEDEIAQRIEYFCGYAACGLEPGEFEKRLESLLLDGFSKARQDEAAATSPVVHPGIEGFDQLTSSAQTGKLPVRQILYDTPTNIVCASADASSGFAETASHAQTGEAVLSDQLRVAAAETNVLQRQSAELPSGLERKTNEEAALKEQGNEDSLQSDDEPDIQMMDEADASFMTKELEARVRLVEHALDMDAWDSMSWDDYDEEDEEEEDVSQESSHQNAFDDAGDKSLPASLEQQDQIRFFKNDDQEVSLHLDPSGISDDDDEADGINPEAAADTADECEWAEAEMNDEETDAENCDEDKDEKEKSA